MNALHGPVPIKTLGQLREQVSLLRVLPDTTPISFYILDEDLERMSSTPNTWECQGLILDAADADGRAHRPLVFAPLTMPTKD